MHAMIITLLLGCESKEDSGTENFMGKCTFDFCIRHLPHNRFESIGSIIYFKFGLPALKFSLSCLILRNPVCSSVVFSFMA